MQYRLVAMDMDGTLLNEKLEISERTKETIKKVKENKVQVTLATGRMYCSVLPFAQQLGLSIPLITYNGALVRDSVTGETYYHEPVPWEYAQQIIQLVQARNIHLNVYLDDKLYVETVNSRADFYASIAGVKPNPVGDLAVFLQKPPTKMLAIAEEKQLAELAKAIRRLLGDKIELTKSHPQFLEMISCKVSKGQALRVLAEKLAIKQEEVIAFGDNYNDLSMLQYAGLGVAMANAPVDVQEQADLVALSNREEGVAGILEKYVLQGGE